MQRSMTKPINSCYANAVMVNNRQNMGVMQNSLESFLPVFSRPQSTQLRLRCKDSQSDGASRDSAPSLATSRACAVGVTGRSRRPDALLCGRRRSAEAAPPDTSQQVRGLAPSRATCSRVLLSVRLLGNVVRESAAERKSVSREVRSSRLASGAAEWRSLAPGGV